ncbi:anthranilate synthase component I family protein [Pseudomonas fluorescens group sp.]|uniref:Anthranilate synthase component I n=2 Tax=Pseudomonas fluorescens TaxID=294 RepID=C3KBN8_PSEFS|nr:MULTISPECIES: anthranilate synthase component I family protein [Pseudomonas fluorescens group]MBZ6459363.1 anthranilate synthase component I family protein [Pseudomonas fluorescens group sp.]MBZ6465437.1 anthranilate synthase component I family protein [Pseudomonas fluorescens group sp.]MBZ6471497.1 anthranilate synthase component I family protein [Pseudomonas fluorescens group sp.]WQD73689.1 anthranilate synthase component I family protein [Pseudomonas marginalis]CAI2795677.1 Putative anth
MRGITTPVSVQLHSERMKCDPLAVYEAAAKVVGADKTFILESLSGPSRDRKATIIGIEPLLAVKIYERRATLEGDEPLINYLRNALSENGIVVDAAGCIAIDSSDSTWDLLRALQAPFDVPRQTHPSLAFFGYLSYDCVRFVEDIPDLTERTNDYPIIALTVFQTLMYFHANATVDVMVNNSALWASRSTDDYVALLADAAGIPADDTPISYPSVTVARDTVQKEQFLGWVDKALEHIRQGDIYQIQLGHEVQVDTPVKPFDVYRALRKNNPSPYMYLANLGGVDLIGASPELFVRIKDELIEMRPIAGTVGKTPGIPSSELILSMTRSEKERAEHLMLVDLCRNDIGRVCQPGSLEVDELMLVEEYSHLYHMVSNVRGLLRKGFDAFDVIKASFPAGTMTGAPKIRAMQIIESMEKNRRGIYAGAVGLIGFDGSINTALCIRSAVHKDGTYYLRASAGVVADSVADNEWTETFHKMGSVYRAVTGKEMLQ